MADLQMFRGDSTEFVVPILRNGIPIDVGTLQNAWFTGKLAYAYADNLAIISRTLVPVGGISLIAPTSLGQLLVIMDPLQTRGLPDGPVKLVYDCQVKDAAGLIFTVDAGTLTVLPDVTRAIT